MATEKEKEEKARKQTNIEDLPENTRVTDEDDKVKGGRRRWSSTSSDADDRPTEE